MMIADYWMRRKKLFGEETLTTFNPRKHFLTH
jgi:hypothetical protein